MAEKMNGLSLDFIIHPGETIKEVLEDRNMKQEELAIRTGFSPKHVSEVVNGKKDISPLFAKSLEYVFDIPMSFWINLQGIYNREILEYEEQEKIDQNELEIVKSLKELIKYAEQLEIISKTKENVSKIIELRKLCNVQNLTYINSLVTNNVAFRKSSTVQTDVYVLYVWLRICEINAQKYNINNDYDANKLRKNLINLKKCMFLDINDSLVKLKNIFAKCGIIFQVVKNFPGAPVQGFIKKKDNKVILSMTLRRSFADEFWFTLFHEIGHLLNEDIIKNQLVDFSNYKSDEENIADNFASDILIEKKSYEKFIKQNNLSKEAIIKFAAEQNVQPYIVVGRIQKETGNYKFCFDMKKKYKWVE